MSAAMINVGLMRENRFPIRNATAHPYACVTSVATGRSSAGCDTRQLAARIWAHGVARLSDVIPLTHVPRRLVDPVGHPRGKPPSFLPPLRWRSADSSPVAQRAIEPSELAILAGVRPSRTQPIVKAPPDSGQAAFDHLGHWRSSCRHLSASGAASDQP